MVLGSGLSSHYAHDVALQPNGKINVTDGNSWTVLQFNANGTLDTTFGKRGQATIPFSGYPTGFAAYGRLVIQAPAVIGIQLESFAVRKRTSKALSNTTAKLSS